MAVQVDKTLENGDPWLRMIYDVGIPADVRSGVSTVKEGIKMALNFCVPDELSP